ncbi:SDR family NAD(P)-dependent oxidoreductase [Campylobacter devanensis]|uniref:SDR family NAD(P)-dependent oxidoreductase n=1 Tax=Campylobacter devanensis TaxID=3161138 RepID=UPI001F2A88AB|nr:SDR family oxidoreductase [Campylobacter sp. P0107]
MIFKDNYFANKQFLVSGASSGIGAHIALVLNSLGAKIIAIGTDEKKLNLKKENVKNQNNFITIVKDISQIDALDKWMIELAKKYGSFDGAVLSAGIQQIAPISSVLSVESAIRLFNINYFGNLQLLKGLIDRRAKSNHGASFVWISSNSSIKAQKGLTNYAASKASINIAVKSIALEIAPKYRVNAISPGFVMTEMIEKWSSIYDKQYIKNISNEYPLGIGSVEDISPLACFLLSQDSSWITGQNIVIDGGGSL